MSRTEVKIKNTCTDHGESCMMIISILGCRCFHGFAGNQTLCPICPSGCFIPFPACPTIKPWDCSSSHSYVCSRGVWEDDRCEHMGGWLWRASCVADLGCRG